MPNLTCSHCKQRVFRPNRQGYNPKHWLCPACQRVAIPTLESLDPQDGGPPLILDPDVANTRARDAASGRRFALGTWHPDAMRVDPETFWLIFREGANWAMREHPKIAPVIPTIAEFILLLSQPLDEPLPERSAEFRAGVVWIMKAGAQISPVLQLAAEMIVLMASTRQASPDLLDICQRLLADEILDLPNGWVGVRREHVRGLRVALDAMGKIATT